MRLVGQRQGAQRLSQQIRQELESYIRTAVRRNIIMRNGNGYSAGAPTFNHYEENYLIKVLRSVIRQEYDHQRDHLLEEIARYLDFDKPTEAMQDRMKSIFNKAIRRGVLYRNGEYEGRVE